MVAGFAGTAVRRIRSPNEQDVLSGRGGGINSHKGNTAFRQWVNERKEDYNLAQNKKEKIAVAMQVVRQVQQQVPVPGRFLQRDPTVVGGNSGQWWVEIDEAKALAKTTQALREGAPKIRQAHRGAEGGGKALKAKKRKRRAAPATAVTKATETRLTDDATEKLVLQTVKEDASYLPRYKSEQLLLPTDYSVAIEQLQENVQKAQQEAESGQDQERPQPTSTMTLTLVAPLTSNKSFREMYGPQKEIVGAAKSPGFNPLALPAVDPFAETPPLMAAPEPDLANDIPVLSLNSGATVLVGDAPAAPASKRRKLHRVHSLALSDTDGTNLDLTTYEATEFVNPFVDESDVLACHNDPNVVRSYVPASVFNQWNNKNGTETTGEGENEKLKIKSIGGYLDRLLSFSSSTPELNNYSEEGPRFRLYDETDNGENSKNNNNDYFFHEIASESDFGAMKSIIEVVHPDGTPLDTKNSTSNLIRRPSLMSRGVVDSRQ